MRRPFRRSRIGSDHHQPDAPEAYDWTTSGRTNQELADGPKTEHGTPAEFHRTAEHYGELFGAAQVSTDDALGDPSGPLMWIKGASKLRTGALKARSLRARMPARQRVKTRQSRKAAASERVRVLPERLKRLEGRLPKAQERSALAKDAVTSLRADLARLPLIQRARFFTAPVVAAIGVIVVVYDVVVLRAALEHAGFGLHGATLLYAAIATPLAIMAVNTVLGVVAGAIALHVPTRERLQLAVAALIAGGGALVVTFILLAIFRAEATSGHSGLLHALSKGTKAPKTILVPWWFAPLQVAGSIAAICAVAMYTCGEAGRNLRNDIAKAEEKAKGLEGKCAGIEADIERTSHELENAAVAVLEVDVDADGAEVEVQTGEEALRAELDAEDGLRESVIGSFRTFYTYTAKIFQNGRVWRVALPTIRKRFDRSYTPPPGDIEMPKVSAPLQEPGSPDSDGGGHMSPDDLERRTNLS
jgi:hypothetical protein